MLGHQAYTVRAVDKMTVKYDVWFLVKVFVLLLFNLECQCQQVGDPCTVKITGDSGVCKIASECPLAEKQAKQGISPTICGFYELIVPIVCCENVFENNTAPNGFGIQSGIVFPSDEVPKIQVNSFPSGAAKKSEQKCLEYTKAVTSVIHAIPLVTNVDPISINVTKCEYNSVPLIVGGAPASAGEFPFMAAVGFPDSDPVWRCGGTLISDKWVLTAAHCTFSRDGGEPQLIRLGSLVLSSTDEPGHQDYDIDQIIVHSGYEYPQKTNDIALISTTKTVKFTKYIRPACLNTKFNVPQSYATATGWGQKEYGGQSSDVLLKVQLNIYDNSECSRAYRNEIRQGIPNTILCAGYLKGGKDTCLGDSGGPLFITENENMCKFHIIGVTSFGKLCAQVNTPAIYTRVSEYIDWIEETIW